jgi:hypothetical protein|tara:strand:+ start:2648 stop:2821 length:174 start_codon:yes stop_codon:yes gene_type:complete
MSVVAVKGDRQAQKELFALAKRMSEMADFGTAAEHIQPKLWVHHSVQILFKVGQSKM